MSALSINSQTEASSPLKRFIIHRPLVAFFSLAFAGAWIVWLPLVLAQNGLGLLHYTIPQLGLYPLSYWFAALSAIAGPTLAAFTVTAVTNGKAGLRQLLRRYGLWRVGFQWYLLILLGLPVAQLACESIFFGAGPLLTLLQKWPLLFTSYLLNVLIIALAVQIWEETGWSGFAVPHLQKRFGAVRACLVLGPLWALWHLPAFFVPGQIFDQKVGPVTMIVQMVILIIFATLIRFIMTWVFNNTMGSLLIAIVLHAALDASNSGSDFIKHLLSGAQFAGYGLGNLLAILVGAVLILIFTRGRLSYKRQPVEAAQSTDVTQQASIV